MVSYIKQKFNGNDRVKYGRITDSVFYIHIKGFSGADPSDFEVIDQIIADNPNAKGCILDIRNNSGGNENHARLIASRFADRERVFQY